MAIQYLKKSPKTSSTDDTKTREIVENILKDIEEKKEEGCKDLGKKFDKYNWRKRGFVNVQVNKNLFKSLFVRIFDFSNKSSENLHIDLSDENIVMLSGLIASFVKLLGKVNLVDVSKIINIAVKKYKSEVQKKQFPKTKHSFKN